MRWFVDRQNKKIVLDLEELTKEDIQKIIELYKDLLTDEGGL